MQSEAEVQLRPGRVTLAYHQRESAMPRANLTSLLGLFRQFGRDTAVVQRRGYRREKRTYAELHADAIFSSFVLGEKRVEPGDRVLLWGTNSAEWIVCFWAVQLRGAIAVPMDAGAGVEVVKKTVRDAGVKLILHDRKLPAPDFGLPLLSMDDLRAVSAKQPVT